MQRYELSSQVSLWKINVQAYATCPFPNILWFAGTYSGEIYQLLNIINFIDLNRECYVCG